MAKHEKDMDKQKQIESLLILARQHNVCLQDVAKEICSLFEDCPAEPERWKPKEGEAYWWLSVEKVVQVWTGELETSSG